MDWDSARDWIDPLYAELSSRRVEMDRMNAYYEGWHDLPFVTPAHQAKMRTEFRRMLDESKSNFMRLLVDVVDERLKVEGYRLGSGDSEADLEAWRIWQANQMDSLHRMAMLDAVVKGVSYVSVWGDMNGDGFPDIAVEDGTETIVSYAAGTNFRVREAALKCWVDGDFEEADVYLPDGVYSFYRKIDREDNYRSSAAPGNEKADWEQVADGFVENPLGVVTIVPIRNRARLIVEGSSELADAISVQNQINGFLFLLALAGYFGAHRQRWATGIKFQQNPETGELEDPWDAAIDKLWATENPEVKLGEFSQTDIKGYLDAIEQKVQHLAVVTRTPKHYLLPTGQDPSGDAIKSSESGLVRKIERKQDQFGEGFEEVMSLARRWMGEDPEIDAEMVWAPAETVSEAVAADATIKKFEAKLISREQALEDLGYSPQQISRMMKAKVAEAMIDSLTPAPPEAPPAEDVPAEGA